MWKKSINRYNTEFYDNWPISDPKPNKDRQTRAQEWERKSGEGESERRVKDRLTGNK